MNSEGIVVLSLFDGVVQETSSANIYDRVWQVAGLGYV
jgi:hypothetical protein